MYTKENLDRLIAGRRTPVAKMELNIEGPTYVLSARQADAEREEQIKLHEKAMRDALRDMRREHQLSRQHGHAKAVFNNPERNIKQRM